MQENRAFDHYFGSLQGVRGFNDRIGIPMKSADIFESRNISWKIYQQQDDFDNNAFMWFEWFRSYAAGSDVYDKGQTRYADLVAEFESNMEAGTLPEVSIIIAPKALSEHAPAHPPAGEDLTARLLQALQRNPKVYAESAFILHYDEGGQFFDHHWAPTPPLDSHAVNCSTVTVEGESNNITSIFIEDQSQPIGLGFRVPAIIISPWTRGNIVVSEIFDHTSVIRFLEVRFNFTSNNISPWRRAMTGDLTSFFDFEKPNYTWPLLPDTSSYVEDTDRHCSLHAPMDPFIASTSSKFSDE
eukprot:gene26554-33154_t